MNFIQKPESASGMFHHGSAERMRAERHREREGENRGSTVLLTVYKNKNTLDNKVIMKATQTTDGTKYRDEAESMDVVCCPRSPPGELGHVMSPP